MEQEAHFVGSLQQKGLQATDMELQIDFLRCVSWVHFAKIHNGINVVTRTERIDNFEQRFTFGNCPNHLTHVMSQSFPTNELTIY